MLTRIAQLVAPAALALGSMTISAPAAADTDEIADGVIDLTAVAAAPAGDAAEFNELFASWENLEQGGRVTASGEITAAPRATFSVPSRMPVNNYQMTSAYGMRNHPILRQRRAHNGVDLAAPTGTPVYATADGVVEMARYFGSYGNYVQIGHMGDLETRYAHLSRFTVRSGDQVRKGDLIGYVGSTGRSTGPHLHYEVRVDGEPVNPVPYMVADLQLAENANGARGGAE